MGRISKVMPVETLVKEVVNTFLKDSTQQYPSFLETTPIFVTYYSRNAYTSTYDTSFENYNEIVGEESPNKFHKIENLPLYALDTSDFGTNLDDAGWTGDVNSSGIILPDTIKPKPDDLIEITLNTKKYLFQVTNGTADNYGNNKFYKIAFKLSQYTKTEAERLTTETFKVDYELIGKQKNTLVKKEYVEYLSQLKDKYDELLEAYKENYFDTTLGAFVFEDMRILDQYVNHFIVENMLFKPFVQFRNSTIISPTIFKYLDRRVYKDSFFKYVKENDYVKLSTSAIDVVQDLTSGNKYYELFYFLKNKAKLAVYRPITPITAEAILKVDFRFLADTAFTTTDSNLQFINLYSKFFMNLNANGQLNNGMVDVNTGLSVEAKEHFETLLNSISDLEALYIRFPEDTMSEYVCNYYSIPIILYALKELYSLIVKT